MRAVVLAIMFVVGLSFTGQAECYDFNCADNRPCANDAGCLGPCICDVESNSCVPQGG